MAKDYANKSKKTKSASRGNSIKKQNKSPVAAAQNNHDVAAAWLVVSIIVVISLAGFFVLKEKHMQGLKHRMQTGLLSKSKKEMIAVNKPIEPEYDFYTILPKEKVWIPKDDENDINNTVVTPKQTILSSGSYIVQVAAFEQYAPADELNAKLTLEGYSVHIDPKPVNGWTRVWLGPFKTFQEAHDVQIKVVDSDNIKGIIQQMQVS